MCSKTIGLIEDINSEYINEDNTSRIEDDFNEEVEEDSEIVGDNNNDKNKDEEYVINYSIEPPKTDINLNIFKCTLCAFAANRRYKLIRHYKYHSNKLPFDCKFCGKGFKTQITLENHLNHHNGVKPYNCKFCSMSFGSSGQVTRHARYRHTLEKPHTCSECDYATVELSKLRRHIRVHTGEKPYQCPHCTYAASDQFKLKRHVKQHLGEKPYKCEICETKFSQSNSLKAHLKLHNGTRLRYKCEMCPSTFSYITNLNKHINRLHTFCAIYCNLCEISYPNRYSYKAHKKMHIAQKCFKCDVCSYESKNMKSLITHMDRHITFEKKFDYEQCSSSFRLNKLLNQHETVNNSNKKRKKIHVCNYCHRAYAYEGNLLKHLVTHVIVKEEKETCNAENASLIGVYELNKSIGYWTPIQNEIIKQVKGNDERYIFYLFYVDTVVHKNGVGQQIVKTESYDC